ncbi:hypothetical protein BB560_000443 [Smittium megazygosporum]|uniref:Uncharacterized protein n=1 Tax=Smittium megazygosporum TaxID=133381 RepID=A0A2T9ZK93_9FUNG|nr:hypothetical protein BB560_000443 [Smittium megazygosporum]
MSSEDLGWFSDIEFDSNTTLVDHDIINNYIDSCLSGSPSKNEALFSDSEFLKIDTNPPSPGLRDKKSNYTEYDSLSIISDFMSSQLSDCYSISDYKNLSSDFLYDSDSSLSASNLISFKEANDDKYTLHKKDSGTVIKHFL